MNILGYITSLLPIFKKDDVLEDVRITNEEMKKTVIPLYHEAAVSLSHHAFSDKAVEDLFNGFKSSVNKDIRSRANIIDTVAAYLPQTLKTGEYIEEQLNNLLAETNINEGLTAKKAVLIRASEQYSFMAEFSMKLLNYVLLKESNVHVTEGAEEELSEGQIKNIRLSIGEFARAIGTLSATDFAAKVEKIPNIVLGKDASAVVASFKRSEVDPFEIGSFMNGFTGNPIYHARLIAAQWQADRYHALKERKKLIEMRIIYLRNTSAGKSDASVERTIQRMQDRVNTLEYNIRKMEESVR